MVAKEEEVEGGMEWEVGVSRCKLLFTEWINKVQLGHSLAVQWLGLHTFTAKGPGSIPGWGIIIPQAMWRGQKQKNKKKVQLYSTERSSG